MKNIYKIEISRKNIVKIQKNYVDNKHCFVLYFISIIMYL